jgi:3-hydroxyisobutyrate dehydrogenase-like beta-hydroxyacid dehydrogenase
MEGERIGFIGVGSMGKPIAKRLLDTGMPLSFTSSRQRTVRELENAGGEALPTPLLVADRSDILFTCLPSDSELFQVFLGPDGVIEHMSNNTMIIDLSSTSPMIIQRVADEARSRAIDVVDAPVSGGTYGAERGILTITVGATEDGYARAKPMLEHLGKEIFHVGGVGMGKIFKAVNNILTGSTMVLVGEVLALANNAGADLELLYKTVGVSSGSSNVWQDIVPKLVHGDLDEEVGFRLEMMRKDMGLAGALGEDLDTPLPMSNLARQFFVGACAQGHGSRHAHEIARLAARASGVEIPEDRFNSGD